MLNVKKDCQYMQVIFRFSRMMWKVQYLSLAAFFVAKSRCKFMSDGSACFLDINKVVVTWNRKVKTRWKKENRLNISQCLTEKKGGVLSKLKKGVSNQTLLNNLY